MVSNSIEKLQAQQRTCGHCKAESIELTQVLRMKNSISISYDDGNDYILHCEKCETCAHLKTHNMEHPMDRELKRYSERPLR